MAFNRLAGVLACVLAIGCGKGEGDGGKADKTPPEATKEATTDTKTTPPADDKAGDSKTPPPDGNASEAECAKILEKSWTALQPVLKKVAVDAAELEEGYKSNKSFLRSCAELSPEHRACLGKSENPAAAIAECKVNEGKKKKLWAPSISPRNKKVELDAAAQEKQLAAVVGTWKSDWVSYKQKTTWKIAKTGDVEATMVRDGKTEKKKLHFTFDQPRRIKVKTTATSSQWYGFLPLDKKTFLASTNLAYDAFPAPDKDKFVVWTRSNWMVNDGGKCEVVSDRGIVTPAECKWSKKGKTPVLTFTYEVPAKAGGSARTSKAVYHYIKGHLVDERMVDIGTFKRK